MNLSFLTGKRSISKVLSAFDSNDESSDDGKAIYSLI